MTNFRPGYLEQGAPLGALPTYVMLTADNQVVNTQNVAYLGLSSDNTTAANRTFTLTDSTLQGQMLTIVFESGSSTSAQLADSGNCALNGAWEPTQYHSLMLCWDDFAGKWIEVGRSPTTSPADISLADGDILVGNSSNIAAAVTMSGDITMDNAGVTSIGAGKVVLADLATAVSPSHVVKYAAQVTTAGGAAAEAITVTGLLSTDLVFCQIKDNGTSNVTILQAVPTANTLTVTFSADPGNDTVIYYQALRATS